MKLKKQILLFAILLAICSCDKDDSNNTSTRSVDKIELTIDNGSTVSYSTNIIAKDLPLASTSGFNCLFIITSENTNNDSFELNFAPTTTNCPYLFTTPSSTTLNGSEINILNIGGVDIDYSNSSNSIVFNYQLFGNNSGDDIKIIFSGTYYDNSNVSHSISGDIDIARQ